MADDDEHTDHETDETFFCAHHDEGDLPAAIEAVRQAFPKTDPMVCVDCKTAVSMRVQFGGRCQLGWTITRDITFVCPQCKGSMGYFI